MFFKVFTEEDILGQAVAFFLAGFETSSSALQFALYELSHNQNIQIKAREEIETVLNQHNGEISYESLQEMKYLDWIFKGTVSSLTTVTISSKIYK